MDIKRLNGYNLKDETARTKIQFLHENKIHKYVNVNEMKTDNTLVKGIHVKTQGFYNASDGGNAEYYIREKTNEDTEDGGIIHFLENDLVAELIIKNYVTPEMFGAKGDGRTDDSNAFTKCFKVGVPIKCIKDKIYGIIHVDIPTQNFILDGNNCIFKNIKQDMSEYRSGDYSFRGISSMFANDVQNLTDESQPYNYAVFKNFTVDQDCYNVIGLDEMHWGGLLTPFLLWNCSDIRIENVKAINTIQTPFHLCGAKNVFMSNCYFENIGKNPYIGTSARNCINVPSITNPKSPIVECTNIIAKNVNDEFIRADNCSSVKISNSTFEKIGGTIIEAHSNDGNLNKLAQYRDLNISNCTLRECKGIFHINSIDNAPLTKVTITNTINDINYTEGSTYFGYMYAKGNNKIKISNSFFECPHNLYTTGIAHFDGKTEVDFENSELLGENASILIRCDGNNVLKINNSKLLSRINICRFTSSEGKGRLYINNCDIESTIIVTGYIKILKLINTIINLTYNSNQGYPFEFTTDHGIFEIINTSVNFDVSELEIDVRLLINLATSNTLDRLIVNGLDINCDRPLRVRFCPVLKKLIFINNYLSHDAQAFIGSRKLQDGCISNFSNNIAYTENVGTNFVVDGIPTLSSNNYHFVFNENE